MQNKHILSITIVIILIMILVPVIYSVTKEYEKNIINVTEKRIIEAAINCYKEDKCTESQITLSKLYENNYLEKEVHPITKKVYSDESYVTKKEDGYHFVESY